MTDQQRIAEITARCEKATPGPWESHTNRHPQCNGEPWGWISGAQENTTWSGRRGKINADFIAHSREDIPFLLSQLAALRAEEEREKGCEYCTGDFEPACNDCPPPWPDARCSACERFKKYSLQRRIREEDAFCRKCGHKLDGGGQDARKGVAGER